MENLFCKHEWGHMKECFKSLVNGNHSSKVVSDPEVWGLHAESRMAVTSNLRAWNVGHNDLEGFLIDPSNVQSDRAVWIDKNQCS